MTCRGSKSQAGQGQASTPSHTRMFAHFRDQMGTISLDVADLSMDLLNLRISLSRWEAAFAASQDSQAKPSKKPPRTAKPRTSTRRKALS